MTKFDPDSVTHFAVQLNQVRWLDGKSFNAAMRAKFPGITDHVLRRAYHDAKVMLALRHALNRDTDE